MKRAKKVSEHQTLGFGDVVPFHDPNDAKVVDAVVLRVHPDGHADLATVFGGAVRLHTHIPPDGTPAGREFGHFTHP